MEKYRPQINLINFYQRRCHSSHQPQKRSRCCYTILWKAVWWVNGLSHLIRARAIVKRRNQQRRPTSTKEVPTPSDHFSKLHILKTVLEFGHLFQWDQKFVRVRFFNDSPPNCWKSPSSENFHYWHIVSYIQQIRWPDNDIIFSRLSLKNERASKIIWIR